MTLKVQVRDINGNPVTGVNISLLELQNQVRHHMATAKGGEYRRHCSLEINLPWVVRYRLSIIFFCALTGTGSTFGSYLFLFNILPLARHVWDQSTGNHSRQIATSLLCFSQLDKTFTLVSCSVTSCFGNAFLCSNIGKQKIGSQMQIRIDALVCSNVGKQSGIEVFQVTRTLILQYCWYYCMFSVRRSAPSLLNFFFFFGEREREREVLTLNEST